MKFETSERKKFKMVALPWGLDVATYLNLNAKVNIGGQMSFKWSDTENGGEGTISKSGGGGSGDAFNTLTTVHLSIIELNSQNVVKFLEYLDVYPVIIIPEMQTVDTFVSFLCLD